MLSGGGQPLQRGHVAGSPAHAVAEGAQPPGPGPQAHQPPLERPHRLPGGTQDCGGPAPGWLLLCLSTHCSEYLRAGLTKLQIGFCEWLLRSCKLFFPTCFHASKLACLKFALFSIFLNAISLCLVCPGTSVL